MEIRNYFTQVLGLLGNPRVCAVRLISSKCDFKQTVITRQVSVQVDRSIWEPIMGKVERLRASGGFNFEKDHPIASEPLRSNAQ